MLNNLLILAHIGTKLTCTAKLSKFCNQNFLYMNVISVPGSGLWFSTVLIDYHFAMGFLSRQVHRSGKCTGSSD